MPLAVILAAAAVLFTSTFSLGDDSVSLFHPAHIDKKNRITGLKWMSARVDDDALSVTLIGKYDVPDWNLLCPLVGGEKVPIGDNAEFTISLPTPAATKVPTFFVKILAIGPRGEVQEETIGVRVPERARGTRRLFPPVALNPAIGLSFLSYQETAKPDFSEKALTLKASLLYQLSPERWDLQAGGYFTLVPFGASRSNVAARYVGLNFRAGYALPFIKDPLRLTLAFGGYFTRMVVTNDAFGYSGIGGPQVYPVIRWKTHKKLSSFAYFKFSPVSDGFKFLRLSNRELAAGGGVSMSLSGGRSLSLYFDFSNLQLKIDEVAIKSISSTISAGYGF